MNKTVSIIVTLGLVIALGVIFYGGSGVGSVQNVEIKDGVQYIRVTAGGGYSPRISSAKAGIPTKLIMKTNGSYDCSSALVIPAIGFQKMLPQTGETEIDIGTPQAGVPLRGVCGMGMYSFLVNFN
jgi:plastocyanin domain-containing protein